MLRGFLSQSTAQRRDIILGESTSRTILFLAVPTLMLGVVQSMMPLMDGLFINNVAGTLVASAVTFSEPVVNMMTSFAMGLSVAAMAILGQLNGRGSFAESKRTATQIVVSGSILGLLSAPLLLVAAVLISRSVNAEIARNVFLYLALYVTVLPFSFMESIYNGIKNANGKPEAPFVRMILMLFLKIIFNFVFIYWLRLGIVGCVLSSLVANVIITVWMFHELFVKDAPDRLELKGFHFDFSIVRQLGRIGFPAMLNSFIINLGFYLINIETQRYGPIVLNGQGIANNITAVCFNLPGSFSSAVTTMVSMNIGAGRPAKAKKSCIAGCAISAMTAVAVIAIVVPLSSRLTLLFTRQADVLSDRRSGSPYLYLFGRRIRPVHDHTGRLYRTGAHYGASRARDPAHLVLSIRLHPGDRESPVVLRDILGQSLFQLRGGAAGADPHSSHAMGFGHRTARRLVSGPRTREKPAATAQRATETAQAFRMPRMKAASGPEPMATLVPRKSRIMTSRGRLPAATARERAKLVTIPVCLSVARAAEAIPRRCWGRRSWRRSCWAPRTGLLRSPPARGRPRSRSRRWSGRAWQSTRAGRRPGTRGPRRGNARADAVRDDSAQGAHDRRTADRGMRAEPR